MSTQYAAHWIVRVRIERQLLNAGRPDEFHVVNVIAVDNEGQEHKTVLFTNGRIKIDGDVVDRERVMAEA